MGVTYIAQCPIEEGKNVQRVLEELQLAIEKNGARKSGLFCVECDTYQSINQNQGKLLHIISNSEYPQSKFAHFEDGASLIADTMLPNFLTKLRSYWLPRKGAKMECKGQRYELNDFLIKVGVLSLGSNTRGLAIEVEYTPCLFVRECWNLLLEMLQSILGSQSPTSMPNLLQMIRISDPYSPEHNSLQYIELFNNCRKVAVAR